MTNDLNSYKILNKFVSELDYPWSFIKLLLDKRDEFSTKLITSII